MAKTTRERIIDAARALFIERGVSGTPVTEIERAAGLSPGSGSFYRHFADRAAVLDAVLAHDIERAVAAREARTGDQDTLGEGYARVLDELDSLGDLIELLAREGRREPERFEPVRRVLAEEGALAESAVLRGRLRPERVDELDVDAVAVVAMFSLIGHHMAERFFGMPIGVTRERFVAALTSMVEGTGRPGERPRSGRRNVRIDSGGIA